MRADDVASAQESEKGDEVGGGALNRSGSKTPMWTFPWNLFGLVIAERIHLKKYPFQQT